MRKLPLKLNIYLFFMYVASFFSLYYFVRFDIIDIHIKDVKMVVFFIFLTALTESFAVYFKKLSFSTGFAVTVAAFVIQGPFAALLSLVFGYCLRIIKDEGQYYHVLNTPKYIVFFNISISIIPPLYGYLFFKLLGGVYGTSEITKYLLPIGAFCVTVYLLNVILLGIFLSLRANEKGIVFFIIENIKLGALNWLAMAPLGLLMANLLYPTNYARLLIFIFPLVLARFTFSLYIDANDKYIQTVDVIIHAMEARDKYTEGHSRRVADISCMIAKEMKFNDWRIDELKMAALMHDAGKIGIDDQILNKPDRLTEEEYNIIKQHPEIGFKILQNIKGIDYVLDVVKYHHERYDGLGYPEGKKANDLPIDVFIVQLADSIDAMTTDRPYRKGLSTDYVEAELKKFRGSQFHPTAVDAYLHAISKNEGEGATR